ncbi:hypothetical protein H8F06_21440 [Vibrio fluvialis]|uniref:phage tail terminator protein n=1 Tax=Vibrio fluvialis TaxID=676 RepID=UPI00192AA8BA|nr:phage tail terminator protein [Vibrio fluvialis]MBL4297846.1 hypothetical protein [Vibrio fluvialis]
MNSNTQVREAVVSHLRDRLPMEMGITVFDTWTIIDADEDTPAVMVYQDNGDLSEDYLDQGEKYDGILQISIYVKGSSSDADLDVIGEAIKEALPQGWRSPNVCRVFRNAFQYERAEGGAYRALHLTHPYKSE